MRTLKNMAVRLARILLLIVFGILFIVALPVIPIVYIISGKDLLDWITKKHETLDSKLIKLLSQENRNKETEKQIIMITLIGIFAVATVSIFIIKYFTGKKKSHSEKSGLGINNTYSSEYKEGLYKIVEVLHPDLKCEIVKALYVNDLTDKEIQKDLPCAIKNLNVRQQTVLLNRLYMERPSLRECIDNIRIKM